MNVLMGLSKGGDVWDLAKEKVLNKFCHKPESPTPVIVIQKGQSIYFI